MKYSYLSETGKRAHNEDFCLSMPSRSVFMVCDGVGGSAKGEVASKLTCELIANYFSDETVNINEHTLADALRHVEYKFTEYTEANPEATGMACTFTFLSISGNQAIAAHAGDSRIYLIRNGEILFCTIDHSVVNDMLASGYLSPEEAKVHPKKNQITRAIQGSDQPTSLDFHTFSFLQPGDFFFLCSDGILESVSEDFLQTHFLIGIEPNAIIEKIKSVCIEYSNDNFSCIVVELPYPPVENVGNLRSPEKSLIQVLPRKNNRNLVLVIGCLLFIIAAAIWYYTNPKLIDTHSQESPNREQSSDTLNKSKPNNNQKFTGSKSTKSGSIPVDENSSTQTKERISTTNTLNKSSTTTKDTNLSASPKRISNKETNVSTIESKSKFLKKTDSLVEKNKPSLSSPVQDTNSNNKKRTIL